MGADGRWGSLLTGARAACTQIDTCRRLWQLALAHWLGRPPLMRAAAMAPGRPSDPSFWLPPENCGRAGNIQPGTHSEQ